MGKDLIERQAAIKAIRKGYPDVINSDYKDGLRIGTDRAIYHIENLPSAQSEQNAYEQGRITGRVEMRTEILSALKNIVGDEVWLNV